jgi:integrase
VPLPAPSGSYCGKYRPPVLPGKSSKRALNRLVAEAEKARRPSSVISLSHMIDDWLRVAEHEESTRETYLGYIERTIKPALGSMSIAKLSVRHLETLYAELRRCRVGCDRKPFIEHKADGEHDCVAAKCKPHLCEPMAASTVRQIHSVISGALSAAVRLGLAGVQPRTVRSAAEAEAPGARSALACRGSKASR